MDKYIFPKDLYVRIEEVNGQGLKAEIYRKLDSTEDELVHMKRVGLVWLRDSKDLKDLEKRLREESSWDAKG